jgi:hypothetical protein
MAERGWRSGDGWLSTRRVVVDTCRAPAVAWNAANRSIGARARRIAPRVGALRYT